MDKNALLYYQSASALKMPLTLAEHMSGFVINLGKRLYFFRGGETPFNCGSSISVTANKYCMNKTLEAAGFPMPKAEAVRKDQFNDEQIDHVLKSVCFPLVVKPMKNTCLGVDVLCNITAIDQLKKYMNQCYERHDFLSLEEFHAGLHCYRVLVFYNKVIGVVQRFPPMVVGDGIHSISALINLQNSDRLQLKDRVSLGLIQVDEECNIRLKELNLSLDTIPKNNETIVLGYTCETSRGGTELSLGKKIASANARLFCKAARALNLNLVGFDVVCEDILVPLEQSRGVIIEANHNPDITIHENPMSGTPSLVSKKMMRRLIYRHPLAYLLGLYQGMRGAIYFKSIAVVSLFLAFKSIFLK